MSERHNFVTGGDDMILALRDIGDMLIKNFIAGGNLLEEADLKILLDLDRSARTKVEKSFLQRFQGGRSNKALKAGASRLIRRRIRAKQGGRQAMTAFSRKLRARWLLALDADRGVPPMLWHARGQAAWDDLVYQRDVAVQLSSYFKRRAVLPEIPIVTLAPESFWFLLWLALQSMEKPAWYRRASQENWRGIQRLSGIAYTGWFRPSWADAWDQWILFETLLADAKRLDPLRGEALLSMYELPLWRGVPSEILPVLHKKESSSFWKKRLAKRHERQHVEAVNRAKTKIVHLSTKDWDRDRPTWLVSWMSGRTSQRETKQHV